MKKLLFMLLLIAVASCNTKDPQPTDVLSGTKWAAYSFGTVKGSSGYKVLQFKNDGYVQMDIQVERTGKVIFDIGSLKYYLKDNQFYIIPPSGKLIEGEILGDRIRMDTTYFEKY